MMTILLQFTISNVSYVLITCCTKHKTFDINQKKHKYEENVGVI